MPVSRAQEETLWTRMPVPREEGWRERGTSPGLRANEVEGWKAQADPALRVCTCTRVSVDAPECERVSVYVHVHRCTSVSTHACECVQVCVCTHVYVHVRTCVYAGAHTLMCTGKWVCESMCTRGCENTHACG